ncbi:hypothetical protein AHAS_Ahas16G0129900 [Arachis hypogaea]
MDINLICKRLKRFIQPTFEVVERDRALFDSVQTPSSRKCGCNTVIRADEMEFPPLPDEHLWGEWNGLHIRPNTLIRQSLKERPMST